MVNITKHQCLTTNAWAQRLLLPAMLMLCLLLVGCGEGDEQKGDINCIVSLDFGELQEFIQQGGNPGSIEGEVQNEAGSVEFIINQCTESDDDTQETNTTVNGADIPGV